MMIFTVSIVNLHAGAGPTPKNGGILRIGKVGGPSTLNPVLTSNYIYQASSIFSSLLMYDENCSLQPDLAESYEMSEDGLNITFHLYGNVSWHDGIEFNASDVKFTFDTILEDPNILENFDYLVSNINSTEVLNASTFIFHLNEPLGATLPYLTFIPIIPRHIYEGTDLWTNPANQNPIGTGPFKFESWVPQVNLTAVANEEYFRGRPYLDSIFYKFFPKAQTPELATYLENNIIDAVISDLNTQIDPSRIQELQNTIGTSMAIKEGPEYRAIWLNMSNPILQNRSVREAIAHAINKTKIVTNAFYGYATSAKGPIPPSIQKWYNPNVADYEFNKTLAEELLDKVYPRTPEWRFNLVIKAMGNPANVPWAANVLYMVRDDLTSVGINATIQFYTPVSDFGSGNFDAFFMGWGLDVLGPDDLYELFHSHGSGNTGNYSNPVVDTLIEEGRRSFNETERKIDFDRAQEIITEDIPQIFLYHTHLGVGYNNDFHGRISNPPINLRFSSYVLEGTWYDRTLSGEGNCPYRVCFTDSEGRRTGYHDGTVYEDIPNSTYSGLDSDPQLVKVREAAGIYTVELFGTENASYKFEFVNIALNYKNVRIPEGFIHENETITYIVKVFQDGSMKVYDYDKYSEHDLGILSIATSKTLIMRLSPTPLIKVTVFNWGNFTETFVVHLRFLPPTGTQDDNNGVLASGERVLALTSAFPYWACGYGNYIISVYCEPVSGEIDMSDNNLTLTVKLTIPGDINGDFAVDIYDAILLANAYNSQPSSPNWNINSDINSDDMVDIYDAILLANHYNEHYP